MKDQDLCKNMGYELNPRVRCAFGKNVFFIRPQNSPKKNLYQVPDIVLSPPKEIRGQDSATFQRLGMVAPRRSNLSKVSFNLRESDKWSSNNKRALAVVESAALSPKASPPMPRHALITPAQVCRRVCQLICINFIDFYLFRRWRTPLKNFKVRRSPTSMRPMATRWTRLTRKNRWRIKSFRRWGWSSSWPLLAPRPLTTRLVERGEKPRWFPGQSAPCTLPWGLTIWPNTMYSKHCIRWWHILAHS